ncbi:hypothetical protein AcV5_001576 [Taiwanofungus camphoratus]|nr:hypothetical protein AcV5_001576 [Antrodia cinnamomea]
MANNLLPEAFYRLPPSDQIVLMGLSHRQMRRWAISQQRDVFQEVSSLIQYLADLRAFQNSIAPVNALPDEILADIFGRVHDGWVYRTTSLSLWSDSYVFERPPCHALSQVCRRWRAVAVTAQKLWSVLCSHLKPRLLRYFLERSGYAMLDIYWRGNCPKALSIAPYRDRVLSLHSSRPVFPEKDPDSLLTLSMPNLEILSFEDQRSHKPFTAFNHQFPKLRHLYLRGALITWTSTIYSCLVSLELYDISESVCEHAIPSMDVFLDVLNACPSLELLKIRESGPSLPRGTAGYPTPTRIVSLSKLRELHLEHSTNNVAYLLAHLAIPAHTFIRIECFAIFYGEGIIADVFPHDTSMLFIFSQTRVLDIDRSGRDLVVLADTQLDGPSRSSLCGRRGSMSMKLIWFDEFRSRVLPQALCELAELFESSPIASFKIDFGWIGDPNEQDIPTDTWENIFECFPHLRDLEIWDHSCDAEPIFQALCSASIGGAEPLCSHLENLSLNNVGFKQETIEEMLACFQLYASRGKRFRNAHIDSVEEPTKLMTGDVLERLQTVIDTFKWDGHYYPADADRNEDPECYLIQYDLSSSSET